MMIGLQTEICIQKKKKPTKKFYSWHGFDLFIKNHHKRKGQVKVSKTIPSLLGL